MCGEDWSTVSCALFKWSFINTRTHTHAHTHTHTHSKQVSKNQNTLLKWFSQSPKKQASHPATSEGQKEKEEVDSSQIEDCPQAKRAKLDWSKYETHFMSSSYADDDIIYYQNIFVVLEYSFFCVCRSLTPLSQLSRSPHHFPPTTRFKLFLMTGKIEMV